MKKLILTDEQYDMLLSILRAAENVDESKMENAENDSSLEPYKHIILKHAVEDVMNHLQRYRPDFMNDVAIYVRDHQDEEKEDVCNYFESILEDIIIKEMNFQSLWIGAIRDASMEKIYDWACGPSALNDVELSIDEKERVIAAFRLYMAEKPDNRPLTERIYSYSFEGWLDADFPNLHAMDNDVYEVLLRTFT